MSIWRHKAKIPTAEFSQGKAVRINQPPPYTAPPGEAFPIAGLHPRFNAFSGHVFKQVRLPDPGAPGWAYTNLGLVEFAPHGNAIPNRDQLHVLQPPVMYAALGVKMQGLGGQASGTFILAPLVLNPLGPNASQELAPEDITSFG